MYPPRLTRLTVTRVSRWPDSQRTSSAFPEAARKRGAYIGVVSGFGMRSALTDGMTARAHVTIRLLAIGWIVTMAILPRAGTNAVKAANAAPEATPAVKASTATSQSHTLFTAAKGPILARR